MLSVRAFAATALLLALSLPAVSTVAEAADQPKSGGILRMYHRDSPGSASIHEGATYSLNIPFMPIFNNLVIYDQHIAQNSLDDIRSRACGKLGVVRRQEDADLQAPAGRQMA